MCQSEGFFRIGILSMNYDTLNYANSQHILKNSIIHRPESSQKVCDTDSDVYFDKAMDYVDKRGAMDKAMDYVDKRGAMDKSMESKDLNIFPPTYPPLQKKCVRLPTKSTASATT